MNASTLRRSWRTETACLLPMSSLFRAKARLQEERGENPV
jgi:hypothetical protein